ncbi:hypothetical protein [Rickettsiella grylli]|uniref:hypothetical protein n=1 Tax=Rickettsiella grylli TaxID=59196 RepID=UPI000AE6AB00|nr:hypothetical protein [Rickettsiella grylli]
MQPRLIRLRDAPNYLGMDRNRFNNEVRPSSHLKLVDKGLPSIVLIWITGPMNLKNIKVVLLSKHCIGNILPINTL